MKPGGEGGFAGAEPPGFTAGRRPHLPRGAFVSSEGPSVAFCVAHRLLCNLRTEWLRTTSVCYLGVDVGVGCRSGVADHQAPSSAASHAGVIVSFTFPTF